ncbi:Sensor histidine kinase TmoS [Pontiella desulfatans]|uniref:Sensor histidine kinase TmoS n=2 Tax=Pontiella desulfatans TaxID=2750659 RepID=A0A6C2U7E9_PONDE|nr:Sensor histidine kinase TmoS [Pontiella desulfatans]
MRPDHSEDVPVILLVEDEADYRLLIASDLEEDYQLVEAANGKEGLEKALETIPDLVVTDLMMPVMDGIELCRRLKAGVETAHIPVVMLTAKTAVESQVEGLQTGADDYVTKPFNMLLLRTRISNLLETRRLLRRHVAREFAWSTEDDPGSNTLDMPELHSDLDRAFWENLTRKLKANYADPGFNPDSLASELNMSPRSLQRKIKALVDLTPVQLIAEYRLKKAETFLKDPEVHVTDVAFEVGFGDLSHFYRIFKKKHGMNPSGYRGEKV